MVQSSAHLINEVKLGKAQPAAYMQILQIPPQQILQIAPK